MANSKKGEICESINFVYSVVPVAIFLEIILCVV